MTQILLELARLQIQESIIGPISEFFFGALGGVSSSIGGVNAVANPQVVPSLPPIAGDVAGAGPSTPGFSLAGSVAGPAPGISVPIGSLALAQQGVGGGGGGGGREVIVQQTINFEPSFIDSRDGARWLQEQRGAIVGIMAEGARNSTALRNQLTGG